MILKNINLATQYTGAGVVMAMVLYAMIQMFPEMIMSALSMGFMPLALFTACACLFWRYVFFEKYGPPEVECQTYMALLPRPITENEETSQ